MNRPSIWTPGFVRLFTGQTVSAVGSQVTFIALPLIAVMNFDATPGAMGLLGALDNLPYLLFGLLVGVVVDRFSRRRIMILSDLLRAAAVGWVPIAFLLGRLDFAQLCLVAFIVGVGNIAFDVACQAHLPELVDETRLADANGALGTSASLATVGAPGIVGALIGWVGAAFAMVLDGLTYLVSAISVLAIRKPEEHRPASDETTWQGVLTGLRLVWRDKRLLGLGGGAAMIMIGMNAASAVLIYFLATQLGLGAVAIGLVFLAMGVGGVAGVLVVSQLNKRLTPGAILIAGPIVAAAGLLGAASAGQLAHMGSLMLVFSSALLLGAGLLAYQMTAAGLRQSLVDDRVRGRALGTLRFLEWGSMPIGSLVGGALGELFGAGPTLLVSAAFVAACCVWTLQTPLRRLPIQGGQSAATVTTVGSRPPDCE